MQKFKYTNDELLSKFKDVVVNDPSHFRPSDVEICEFWTSMITGENQEKFVNALRKSETKEQKEQRNSITNTVTREVTNKVLTPFDEVDRCDSITNILHYEGSLDEDDPGIRAIREAEKVFFADMPVDSWLNENFKMYSTMDPNAFLVVDIEKGEDQKNWAYPSVIRSEQVIEYEYYNGRLQYLICRVIIKVKSKGVVTQIPKYYCYGPDLTWSIVPKKEGAQSLAGKKSEIISLKAYRRNTLSFELDDGKLVKNTSPTGPAIETEFSYILTEHPLKSKGVPAMQFGYVKNVSTGGENYESVLSPAKELYVDLIQKKSTHDLHLALHGFAQKFAYLPRCNWKDMETMEVCNDGKRGLSEEACPKCSGTGKMPLHLSEQDLITLELILDEDRANVDVIDLAKMIYFAEIPQHIIEMHDSNVKEKKKDVALAVYNTNIFDRAELSAATATEIKQNLRAVNNVLARYATKKAEMYCFIIRQIAVYRNVDKGLIVERSYPSDFKLETIDDLLVQRKEASSANAPHHIIKKIDAAILAKQNVDSPETVARVTARERWRPFVNLSMNERQTAIALLPKSSKKRILHLYFDDVFRDIENDPKYKDFHKWKYERQKSIIDEVLGPYMERHLSEDGSANQEGFPEDNESGDGDEGLEGGQSQGGAEGKKATVKDILSLYVIKKINREAAVAQLVKITKQPAAEINIILDEAENAIEEQQNA